ncbi:sulfite oxidase heme-binding subunit YedZ [Casimicrobium huifangae]|jgi:sulfoxide reductase heme-binding subunit YedZ|uniref:sulfite oxidase heme-binding subunit YedZ n=1 Tax=Casimicrobium huifangae TaxID=2591109 RepID=UPI003783F132
MAASLSAAGAAQRSWRNPANATVQRVKWTLIAVGLLPLLRLVAGYFLGWLGANPIEFITRSTGTWTLVGLAITLSITPLRKLLNWPWLLRLRRTAGLLAFFYACLHFTTYIWFDRFFDLDDILKDIVKRPFITVGFAAFVLLVPLAATSNNAIIKRLGARLWQRIHYAVYLIAVLAVVHYWWLVKKDITQPAIYAAVFFLLLALRLFWKLRDVTQGRNAGDSKRRPIENQRA